MVVWWLVFYGIHVARTKFARIPRYCRVYITLEGLCNKGIVVYTPKSVPELFVCSVESQVQLFHPLARLAAPATVQAATLGATARWDIRRRRKAV